MHANNEASTGPRIVRSPHTTTPPPLPPPLPPESPGKALSVNSLADVCQHGRISLRKSAVQLLLDRAMREDLLPHVIAALGNRDTALKAAVVTELLVKKESFRDRLVEAGCLEPLLACLDQTSEESSSSSNNNPEGNAILKVALIALFDLAQAENVKPRLMELGVLHKLLNLLREPLHTRPRDSIYWTLALLHHLIQDESLRGAIASGKAAAAILARVAGFCHGANNLQKLCLHSLVLLATADQSQELSVLNSIVEQGFICFAVANFKSEDPEVVYWSLGLIHELALKSIAKDEIRSTPRVVRGFIDVLATSEAPVQKVVLRTLGFLSIKNDNFKTRMLTQPLLERLTICMGSGDTELAHWAVVLLHDIAMLGNDICTQLVGSHGLLSALCKLAVRNNIVLSKLCAETLGFICSSESNHPQTIAAGIIPAVLSFMRSEDGELHFWGSVLVLGLAVSSDLARKQILETKGEDDLIRLALSSESEKVNR